MNDTNCPARSPELMSQGDTALLIIDVQEKLIRHIDGYSRVVWNCGRLVDAALRLKMPVAATEQYPQGLGPTVPSLAKRFESIPAKTLFSCRGAEGLFDQFQRQQTPKLLLGGIEAHVCVQQTCFDLLAEGFQVYLAADAIGARNSLDHRYAMRRMESAGATVTTSEAAMFEWCEDSRNEGFKDISQLVQQTPPL